MPIEVWTLGIAAVTAVACSLCGTILLVARKSMISEGLSHAVLPGLVIAFAWTRDYSSPLLMISAAACGMIMVWLTHLIHASGLVDDDAGLGIVFAGMFSFGIAFVSLELKNTHIHADCVIDGNLALAALDRLRFWQIDLGPRSFYVMLVILLAVVSFIFVGFKEIQIGIFDPILARQFRLRPALLQICWLSIVSLTTVAAFEVAGSVLIVALMIAPPAAASLLSNRLGAIFAIAASLSVLSAFTGYSLAWYLDISPNGPIASISGVMFLLIVVFAPQRGLISVWLHHQLERRRTRLALAIHQMERDHPPVDGGRSALESLDQGLVDELVRQKLVDPEAEGFVVTDQGRAFLAEVRHL